MRILKQPSAHLADSQNIHEALPCEKLREPWANENKTAIEAYNEYVESFGVFSDPLRTF